MSLLPFHNNVCGNLNSCWVRIARIRPQCVDYCQVLTSALITTFYISNDQTGQHYIAITITASVILSVQVLVPTQVLIHDLHTYLNNGTCSMTVPSKDCCAATIVRLDCYILRLLHCNKCMLQQLYAQQHCFDN